MRYLIATILLLALGCRMPEKKQQLIRVSGEGKIRVKPDLVILTIEASFTRPRMVEAVRLTQETVDSVLNILRQFAANENDIKTSTISANKDYDYNGRKQVFTGYNATQSIDFVLRDIGQFTALTGKLLETKMSSISQIQFSHSKSDSLLREADLLAYDDALQSAKKLSSRAHVSLGKLLFVSNAERPGVEQENGNYADGERINTYAKVIGGRGFTISPEVIEFKRSIISEYEIHD